MKLKSLNLKIYRLRTGTCDLWWRSDVSYYQLRYERQILNEKRDRKRRRRIKIVSVVTSNNSNKIFRCTWYDHDYILNGFSIYKILWLTKVHVTCCVFTRYYCTKQVKDNNVRGDLNLTCSILLAKNVYFSVVTWPCNGIVMHNTWSDLNVWICEVILSCCKIILFFIMPDWKWKERNYSKSFKFHRYQQVCSIK